MIVVSPAVIEALRSLPWAPMCGALFFTVAALVVVLRSVGKRLDRRKPGEGRGLVRLANVLSAVMTLAGLGWSAEAMWEIAHNKIGLNTAYTIFVFGVFEMALLVSMIRAHMHMKAEDWPGRPGRTVWGMALFMGVVACTIAEHGLPEYLVRFAVPLVVAKLWWDGVVGNATKPAQTESEWTITPQRVLIWLRLKRPVKSESDRERLIAKVTRIEFLRRHGSKRLAARRAWRVRQLSLLLDDAAVAQVRHSVARANWLVTAHPATHDDAPGDAPVAQVNGARVDASQDRVKAAVSSSDADRVDAATRAARLFQLGEFESIRAAADAVPGASEATVRRRLKSMGGAPRVNGRATVTQPNGSHEPPRPGGRVNGEAVDAAAEESNRLNELEGSNA